MSDLTQFDLSTEVAMNDNIALSSMEHLSNQRLSPSKGKNANKEEPKTEDTAVNEHKSVGPSVCENNDIICDHFGSSL